jgi:hypothetical protein
MTIYICDHLIAIKVMWIVMSCLCHEPISKWGNELAATTFRGAFFCFMRSCGFTGNCWEGTSYGMNRNWTLACPVLSYPKRICLIYSPSLIDP